MKNLNLQLYLVSDSTYSDETKFLEIIELALKGGITLLQLREKHKTHEEYLELAKKVKKLSDQYSVPLIIDDDVSIAKEIGAAGVHVGDEDMPVKEVRRILGSDFIIGASAKSVEAAVKAYKDGADYLGVGAIFPTATKVKTKLTSVETLKDICANVPIPICAIGGLDSSNLNTVAHTGIKGVAVVRAIIKAENPESSARELLELSKEICTMPK